MIYPKFINEKSTIGVTAPSDGINGNLDLKRLDNAIKNFKDKGYEIIETNNVRKSIKGKSTSSKGQSRELEELFKDEKVSAIICAAGGDFLNEMLTYFDFNVVKNNPKWIQGYSDPTGLLFTITTKYDIATLYSNNIKVFGMNHWHKSLSDNLKILKGNLIVQETFPKYEKESFKQITGLEEYNLTENVNLEILNCDEVKVNGRIIGGCIDCLSDIFGTRFDNVENFIEKYKNDGIIWFFDKADISNDELIRTLWKFKINGWFKYTKCILFSRVYSNESNYNISYKEAIKRVLNDLNIPIVINCSFGHVPPRITVINGAIVNIKINENKGKINFILN